MTSEYSGHLSENGFDILSVHSSDNELYDQSLGSDMDYTSRHAGSIDEVLSASENDADNEDDMTSHTRGGMASSYGTISELADNTRDSSIDEILNASENDADNEDDMTSHTRGGMASSYGTISELAANTKDEGSQADSLNDPVEPDDASIHSTSERIPVGDKGLVLPTTFHDPPHHPSARYHPQSEGAWDHKRQLAVDDALWVYRNRSEPLGLAMLEKLNWDGKLDILIAGKRVCQRECDKRQTSYFKGLLNLLALLCDLRVIWAIIVIACIGNLLWRKWTVWTQVCKPGSCGWAHLRPAFKVTYQRLMRQFDKIYEQPWASKREDVRNLPSAVVTPSLESIEDMFREVAIQFYRLLAKLLRLIF